MVFRSMLREEPLPHPPIYIKISVSVHLLFLRSEERRVVVWIPIMIFPFAMSERFLYIWEGGVRVLPLT